MDKLENCFANTFCKIQNMKCLGKNTKDLEIKLGKLFMALYLLDCGTDECEIECFINKNCNC